MNGDTAATAVTGTPPDHHGSAGSPAGTYPITPAIGTLAAANYTFKFANGTLTVNKAILTITANNASVAYNAAIPAFAYTPSGFVNGDTAAVLTGAPAETTTATVGFLPGHLSHQHRRGNADRHQLLVHLQERNLTITALGTVATPTFTPVARNLRRRPERNHH